jgi:hypothetical protein
MESEGHFTFRIDIIFLQVPLQIDKHVSNSYFSSSRYVQVSAAEIISSCAGFIDGRYGTFVTVMSPKSHVYWYW